MYLVCLVQQLHPLLQNLAVILATLPQHLPPQFLHCCAQFISLQLVQRLTILDHLATGMMDRGTDVTSSADITQPLFVCLHMCVCVRAEQIAIVI